VALRGLRGTRLKDGQTIVEVTVPGNGNREVTWDVRRAGECRAAWLRDASPLDEIFRSPLVP
jgi:hypothetical protein